MRFSSVASVFLVIALSAHAQFVLTDDSICRHTLLSTYEARTAFLDTINAPLYEFIAAGETEYYPRSTVNPVKILSVRKQEGAYILFIPGYKGSYPLDSPGTWVIKRSLEDGSFVQAKIFLGGSPDNAIRIYPDGNISRMDISIMGAELKKALFIRQSFGEVLSMSLDTLISETSEQVDWQAILPPPDNTLCKNIKNMADSILANISFFPDADDGALDEKGHFVFISDKKPLPKPGFNCSGFAKWVGDSISYSLTGKLLRIDELKQRLTGLRGTPMSEIYEEIRDPYFGLDWTRNLAYKINSLLGLGNPTSKEAWDVRTLYSLRYIEDKGYRAEQLYQALYLAAIEYPGYFFLGSVNGYWGKDPVLWQHYHVAAFFPYFDDDGKFHVAVVERNRSTALSAFIKRYPDNYVHLVRVKAPQTFIPYMPWK
ncbi:hypothetical protein WKV44_05255 [Spirochaetia bacterium 38H-sp]|uniref:Protein glutaminase domain-containing protein n=1 Tax=Rarispira pelagica TaxID=3141764 RepID=A0ABU9UBC5_9SPIR